MECVGCGDPWSGRENILLHLPKDSQLSFCCFDPFSFPKLIPRNLILLVLRVQEGLEEPFCLCRSLRLLSGCCCQHPVPAVPARTWCSPATWGGESEGHTRIPLKGGCQFLTGALNFPLKSQGT